MNQKEIDELSKALRKQGLTWNQTNFAVSLVRNMQDKEREACAVTSENFSTRDGYEIAHKIRMRSNAKVTGDSPAFMAKRPVD